MKYYAIQQAGREAHVCIFGDIKPWRWKENDTSAWSLQQELKDLDADVIHVHIDSYGGVVSEGWTIYNVLRQHKAKIITHADGFVASAAIYPFMAGDQRIAASLSSFFFHQAMTSAYGNADQLREAAEDIEKINEQGLAVFTDLGIDADRILQLEKDETWLSPQEALALGIATEVRKRSEENGPSQSVRRLVMQSLAQRDAGNPRPSGPPEPAAQHEQESASENRLKAFLGRI